MRAPVDVVGDIWRGDGGSRPGCLAEAKRYHRDFGLSAWVRDQNEGKAVAPTPQMIIRRLRMMAADREPFAQSSALRLDNKENSKQVGTALVPSVGSALRVLCGAGADVCSGKAGEGAALGS